MQKIFRNLRNQHGMLPSREPGKIREKLRDAGEDPDSFYWFGFLRNPWDRVVSRYMFEQERSKSPGVLGRISKGALAYHKKMIHNSWDEYVKTNPYDPQSKWLSDTSGVVVERVYRMEDMAGSLVEIGDRIGRQLNLPERRGETKRERDYRGYYESREQVEAVAKYYAMDIMLGGYYYDSPSTASYDIKRFVASKEQGW